MQTTVQSNKKTSKIMFVAIGVIISVALVFVALLLPSMLGSNVNSGTPPSSNVQSPVTSNIVNGLVTVNSGSYEYYQISVPTGASNVQISGTFTASGGSGNDIKVYVMDSTNFVTWKSGNSASTYYNSGQVTSGSISTTLPGAGTYYLVYDKHFLQSLRRT